MLILTIEQLDITLDLFSLFIWLFCYISACSFWGGTFGGIGQLQRYSNRNPISLPYSRMLISLCLPVINAKEWEAYQNEMSHPCKPF